MLDGQDLDPYVVLGIARDATPEQVREAFRRQSKKHHPDHGGDEWAFRIVARAYDLLNGRPAPRAPVAPGPAPFRGPWPNPEDASEADAGPIGDWAAENERIRPGVQDKGFEPGRMVLVEVLWIRLEVADIYALIGRREGGQFSGSLHLRWPDPDATIEQTPGPDELHEVIGALSEAFDRLRNRPGVVNARSMVDRGRFEAWLSFPSGHDAWTAFNALRPELNARGLGARQVTRDLTIPREPKAP